MSKKDPLADRGGKMPEPNKLNKMDKTDKMLATVVRSYIGKFLQALQKEMTIFYLLFSLFLFQFSID